MYKVTKEFTFDAAHRLLDYDGPCKNLHGHTYLVIVELNGYLDHQGFVVDYAEVKEKCKGWVDEHWDHGSILNIQDTQLIHLLGQENSKIYTLDCNPTAENMAKYLFEKFNPMFQKYLKEIRLPPILGKVTIKETPTSSASYE